MNNTATIKDEKIIDMRYYKEKKAELKRVRKKFKKAQKVKRTAVEHALSLILILFVAEAVMFLLIQPYIGINDLIGGEICMAVTALTAVLLTRSFSKVKLSERAGVKKFDILTVIMLTIAAYSGPELVDNIVCAVCSNFMTVEPNTNEVGVIGAVICAPIFEELIFRFGFIELTRRHYSRPFVIIFSSVFFTILHGYNIQGFMNVFTAALMMGLVYYFTRNIFLTMAEHAIHNAICCITPEDMKLFGTPIYSDHNGFVASSTAWIILNAVLFAVSIIIFVKYFVPKYMKKNEE